MGQKLENVRKKAENVKELGEQVKELGNKVVDDITSVRDILGEMPEDMDDDIMEAIEQVDDSSTQEATDNMNSEVKDFWTRTRISMQKLQTKLPNRKKRARTPAASSPRSTATASANPAQMLRSAQQTAQKLLAKQEIRHRNMQIRQTMISTVIWMQLCGTDKLCTL